MSITKEQVAHQLRQVQDPELHRDVITLGIVQHVAYCDGYATLKLDWGDRPEPVRTRLRREIEGAIRSLGDEIREVRFDVALTVQKSEPKSSGAAASAAVSGSNSPEPTPPALPDVDRIIAVGAGKGGVGKSTLAVNLAVALARTGLQVGLLDGDIYGPSLPTMLGLDRFEPRVVGKTFLPFEVHGIKAMSIGPLVDDDKPLIWRGPMAHGAFKQLATQTDWGTLDYLIIDLPPGTGDVPLTMAQTLPLTGAVVVCTPQKVAQDDARRAVRMFQTLNIDVLGIVENMSYFIGDDGKEYDIFGKGGAQMLAHTMGVPFLGTVPIHMALRRNSDAGDPTANFTANAQLANELGVVAKNLQDQANVAAMEAQAEAPTISVR